MSIPGPEQQKMIGEESKNKEREFQSAESCKKNSIQNLKILFMQSEFYQLSAVVVMIRINNFLPDLLVCS
jgi:hypothetical protein